MYMDCRRRLERAVESSTDFTNWSLVQSKSDVRLYQHERNASNQLCAMRLVIQVPGSVYSSVELLRLLDGPSFRSMMKELQGKTFIDGEVLLSDVRRNDDAESLALKWIALNTGAMFTKPKEFLYYEYCGVLSSRKFGPTGICLFESYDGLGAQYGIRAKPDSYKLATFEPSFFVMTPSNDPGKTVVTLTISSKKAGGSNLVSSALKALMLKYTSHFANLESCARASPLLHKPPPDFQHHVAPRSMPRDLPRTSSGDSSSSRMAPPLSAPASHHQAAPPPPPFSSPDMATTTRKKKSKRQEYVNDDFEEICRSAMQVLDCPMAGIRTNLFELVHYADHVNPAEMPKSLPTFRRMAQSGKPCVVLDVNSDKRISVDRRQSSRIQFFVGVPLTIDSGECIGDICVADVKPRKVIDYNALEILKVLAQSATQYMSAAEYLAENTDLPRDMELDGTTARHGRSQGHHRSSAPAGVGHPTSSSHSSSSGGDRSHYGPASFGGSRTDHYPYDTDDRRRHTDHHHHEPDMREDEF
ncbi:Aste57867_15568 [Aphanomyces stellatus]|uniref:Aste57867_15568 protein n=1 Tax=Aphanomyces stellatus TaxID=120398 RepID=A0A485L4E0_9STRA|nr:hypothetical protein As57867_015512 [Aphanomyces stellatus]VFT92370.1 Aste57867_15568 [Aphanomyces stellatus]